jgi:hypothetical protein
LRFRAKVLLKGTKSRMPEARRGSRDLSAMPPPIALSDEQLGAIMRACAPLQPDARGACGDAVARARREPDECDDSGVAFRCRTARIISRRDIPPRIRRLWQADRRAVLTAYWESLEMGQSFRL